MRDSGLKPSGPHFQGGSHPSVSLDLSGNPLRKAQASPDILSAQRGPHPFISCGGKNWKSLGGIRSSRPTWALGLELEGRVTSGPRREPAGVLQTSPAQGHAWGTCFSQEQAVLRTGADLTYSQSGGPPCDPLQVPPNPGSGRGQLLREGA